jgi:hypothetical protein
MEPLMDILQLAEKLGVRPRYIRNRCSRKFCLKNGVAPIRFCRLGNRLKFRVSDVEEYLRATELAASKNEWR